MDPRHQKLLRNAQQLELAGKALDAAAAYKEFLAAEPSHVDAWSDYAGQLMRLDQLEEAKQACERALGIDHQHPSAKINLGCILMRWEQLDEAEFQFRFVLLADSGRLDARLCLAECLLKKRDLKSARRILDGAHQHGALDKKYSGLVNSHANQWSTLGSTLLEERNCSGAEEAFSHALQVDPHHFLARANLAEIKVAQGRMTEAEVSFRKLVADYPLKPDARLWLLRFLFIKGDRTAADQELAEILRQAPNDFLVHTILTSTYYGHGLWAEYRAEIERYRQVDPASAYPEFEQSFADLISGDLLRGWERYEARLRLPNELHPEHSFVQPAWSGAPFAGKTILLWAEQGFGDSLMFLRYVPLVKAMGGRVILETQPALLSLAATCAGADLVVPQGGRLPPFDLQASLMSLPWLFRTELSTIPAETSYLRVPEKVPHAAGIQEQLTLSQGNRRIGLVWAGNPNHPRDVERSLPAALLAPLAALPGVSWFSFQLRRSEEVPLPNLVSLAPLLGDFADTAYALSNMDLLITVDTSITHLAGALGIPTLVLLAFMPDYRWMLGRNDSPWYPSLRLYRQPSYGDWESVIQQILLNLSQPS